MRPPLLVRASGSDPADPALAGANHRTSGHFPQATTSPGRERPDPRRRLAADRRRHRCQQRHRRGDRAPAGRATAARSSRRPGGLDRLGELAADAPRRSARARSTSPTRARSRQLADAVPDVRPAGRQRRWRVRRRPGRRGRPDVWARMYDVNVARHACGPCRPLLPALLARAAGHVVLTGSTAGRWVYEGGARLRRRPSTPWPRCARRCGWSRRARPVRVSEIAPGMVADRGVLADPLRRRRRPGRGGLRGRRGADRRGRRRRHRLGGHPPGARQHRPGAGHPAAAGVGDQGARRT